MAPIRAAVTGKNRGFPSLSSIFHVIDRPGRPIAPVYRTNTLYLLINADIMRPFAVAPSDDVAHWPLAAASVEEPNEKRRNP